MTCASSRARSWQCKPQPQTRRDGFAVEDTVAIALRFANGALGTFLLSDTAAAPYSWEQPAGENPSYPRLDDEDCYVLAGTHGSLGVPTMRLRTYAGERSWCQPFHTEMVPVARADPLARQLDHFCDVIRGAAQPLVTGRDALQTLRVTLAIREAAATRQIIAVPRDQTLDDEPHARRM